MSRPQSKQVEILAELRRRMVAGPYAPGAQLPTRSELERSFQASRMTVQRVLDQLTADGFVYARGRLGTFVSKHPPHLSRYGLVFPFRNNQDANWSRFWEVLQQVAKQADAAGPLRVPFYYGAEFKDHDSYFRLVEDVESSRLAGLIFATGPIYLTPDSILMTAPVPRVAVMDRPMPGIAALALDHDSYIRRALDHFQACGRSRIGFVLGTHSEAFRQKLYAAVAARGMQTQRHWTQLVSPRFGIGARNAAHLLLHPDQHLRPDSLLIADDHLNEHALAGLADAGAVIGQDLDVVLHGNFPSATPLAVPAKRLGYDLHAVLEEGRALIDALRAGRAAADSTVRIPAVFEEETTRPAWSAQVA